MRMFALKAYTGAPFLGGRGAANRLRLNVMSALAKDFDRACLDFTGVEDVSHSFADELLTPLYQALGTSVSQKVFLENCSDFVVETLVAVARMHRVALPQINGASYAVEARDPERVYEAV